jgi:hypothetical protein
MHFQHDPFVRHMRRHFIWVEAARIRESGGRLASPAEIRAATNERYEMFRLDKLSDEEFALLLEWSKGGRPCSPPVDQIELNVRCESEALFHLDPAVPKGATHD